MKIKEYLTFTNLILLIFLFIFFEIGNIISEIIDFQFLEHDLNKRDRYTLIETILEIMIAYVVYFILNKEFNGLAFRLLGMKNIPSIYPTLLSVAFSIGIFNNLYKSNNKMKYIKEKYLIHF